ncbi:DUF3558 domain-containing protein [Amycolatopsis sp. WAC 04182]|uniref:DUF3558 domain-containing protein n=1 Tax=Amycolatopsis sp. WAC 04182 TaxID=2203198 RepID=UPI000F773568|nr:DUF3558 domain-containing protein [Amycolatopsis sp. WAC 04182]RSN59061.1 DUF3558 domain-containing protein [Amycolatopsis sp. WAC 04182]
MKKTGTRPLKGIYDQINGAVPHCPRSSGSTLPPQPNHGEPGSRQAKAGRALRTRRLIIASTIICTTLLLATACNDDKTSGSPTSAPASSSGLPRAGAPAVRSPLKTDLLAADPCGAATKTEVEGVGGALKSTAAEDIASGRGCAWIFAESAGNVSGALNVGQPDGLSHLYALKAQGSGVTTFKPLPDIAGYPAVEYANGGEGKGACQLAVGLRDDVTYVLVTQLRRGNPYLDDPCGLSVKIAEFTIQHLKAVQ